MSEINVVFKNGIIENNNIFLVKNGFRKIGNISVLNHGKNKRKYIVNIGDETFEFEKKNGMLLFVMKILDEIE